MHKHLRRLDRIWAPQALFFVTTCVRDRRPILACEQAEGILREEWAAAAARHGWLIGRYVIMPDHVHFFRAERPVGAQRSLSAFVGSWKEWTSKKMVRLGLTTGPVWQKEFFDRLLRSDESYAEKWSYVRDNPVRAGLVGRWEDWPWQGFVDFDSPL